MLGESNRRRFRASPRAWRRFAQATALYCAANLAWSLWLLAGDFAIAPAHPVCAALLGAVHVTTGLAMAACVEILSAHLRRGFGS